MYVSFAYSGWNVAAYRAGEVERPERSLPRSLLIGTGVVMALFPLLRVVYLYSLPTSVLAGPTDRFAPISDNSCAPTGSHLLSALARTALEPLKRACAAAALLSASVALVLATPAHARKCNVRTGDGGRPPGHSTRGHAFDEGAREDATQFCAQGRIEGDSIAQRMTKMRRRTGRSEEGLDLVLDDPVQDGAPRPRSLPGVIANRQRTGCRQMMHAAVWTAGRSHANAARVR